MGVVLKATEKFSGFLYYIQTKNPKPSPIGNSFGLFAFGGGEGSRTPVRKTFLPTFYERSCLFDLVLFCGKQHPRKKTSPLVRDGIQGYFPCTFTAT